MGAVNGPQVIVPSVLLVMLKVPVPMTNSS